MYSVNFFGSHQVRVPFCSITRLSHYKFTLSLRYHRVFLEATTVVTFRCKLKMGAGVKFVILLRLFLEVGKSCFFIPIWLEAASLTPGSDR